MIGRVFDFITGRDKPEARGTPGDIETAVAALLIEAARMDDSFDVDERGTIERLLAQKFALSVPAVQRLIDEASHAVEHSNQMFPFTRDICTHLPPEERVQIIEMLWRVAYADGALDPHEDMLLRRIAGLIHVTDRERALARQRALAKPSAGSND